MQKPLVSLITPCYNTGLYIFRLLDSVLHQTYPNIEMWVIDDGSTDNSKEVIVSYIPKFVAKGYSLHYFYQENSGQSVAVQKGLELVKGKYLAWPDSDDFYSSSEAIEKMVSALDSASNEFAMVRTQELLLDELDLHVVGLNGENVKKKEDKSLFEDCLFCQNGFYFCPGAYMVDLEKLLESASWPMYSSKNAGQNWQLFLPVLWNYRCISIPEKLYSVLERRNSHSRGQYIGFENLVSKFTAYSDTILSTLDKIKGMPKDTCESYKKKIYNKYLKQFLMLAFRYGYISDFDTYYLQLGTNEFKYKLLKFFVHLRISKLVWKVYSICLKIKRKLK